MSVPLKMEDLDSGVKFLSLNLDSNQQMSDFYNNETHKKYLLEVGPRGGKKYLGKKESRRKNPLLRKGISDFDNSFYEYKKYLVNKRKKKKSI